MNHKVAIRRVGPDRAEDYRRIRLMGLERDPDGFGSTLAAEADRPFSHFVERVSECPVFGAYVDETIVGMVGLKRETGEKTRHRATIWGVYTAAEWRGHGIAERLMKAAIAHARDEGVLQLHLAVYAANRPALSLYQRLGFRVYGLDPRGLRQPWGFAHDALMVLQLDD